MADSNSKCEMMATESEPSWEGKRSWLLKHGYMKEVDGVDMLSAEATARLGGDVVTGKDLADSVKNGSLSGKTVGFMCEGASFMRDIYGTSDIVELLYASFSGEEASSR